MPSCAIFGMSADCLKELSSVDGVRLRGSFLWLSSQGASIGTVTPELITRYFSVRKARVWKRATIKFHGDTFRSFFRYASSQNWCDCVLAATIHGPRMYAYEHLPQGPAWTDVSLLSRSGPAFSGHCPELHRPSRAPGDGFRASSHC